MSRQGQRHHMELKLFHLALMHSRRSVTVDRTAKAALPRVLSSLDDHGICRRTIEFDENCDLWHFSYARDCWSLPLQRSKVRQTTRKRRITKNTDSVAPSPRHRRLSTDSTNMPKNSSLTITISAGATPPHGQNDFPERDRASSERACNGRAAHYVDSWKLCARRKTPCHAQTQL